ncbi:RING and UBP finger domain protein [Cordyceps fumosorosea ARSEF 2679]|uniref:RING and UBP finger domain protein n=1 Tax=Cordyceps fumosorosea (strain ARSEF 2679) TaxID=1081104 RepID=A0A168BLC1_CORFA|nr:RING and UBP finger domain protein [Cordyceps fumosorosea ARSEF 2679]OAA70265.1 RING and UBP finger domain protein [Cordyceps fumosorosea ARSEF 2679]
MPSYFYHLKFELYPTSDPTVTQDTPDSDVWLPTPQTSVFDHLPAHATRIDGATTAHSGKSFDASWDWRFDCVTIETIDPVEIMAAAEGETSNNGAVTAPSLGPNFSGPGTAVKAKCVRLENHITNVGWGVVHFYRDDQESPELWLPEVRQVVGEDEDCTTLCIPAVPAYMTPGDLWGFIGDRWRDDVIHCRTVMTSNMNRYLALLKFRHSKVAREWQKQFEGAVFTMMEPETCHVVFVKSITFETPAQTSNNERVASSSSTAAFETPKLFPPPMPDLVELPTCPVCLELLDETSGIMTIPCAHVFHCTCLESWKGGRCPVCRFANTTSGVGPGVSPFSRPFGSDVSNLCNVCDSTEDLWICLICGYVGCGRYKGGHAKDHWKDTSHCFALELETQYVWDYADDAWAHRRIREKGDGKLVELPRRSGNGMSSAAADEEMVPRAKLDNMGFEYTHLITTQLESQRTYYEGLLHKAVAKASKATATAESTTRQIAATTEQHSALDVKFRTLSLETVPQLERDLERERNKSAKSEALARNLSRSLQEEKRVSEGLLKRVEHLGATGEETRRQLEALRQEMEEMKEMNRDLSMFISGQQKLKEMEEQGQLEEGELADGSASVPAKKTRRKGRR